VNGKIKHFAVSRQMVLFAVERRKAWRMLQSKAGIVNKDYLAQKSLLTKLEKGEISQADLQGKTRELFEKELAALG
jgi:pyruvate-ferredoxin/flavodoxin oxidoreductase